jgi:predicted AlkP superfamily phosphohydrolase/phosphomutase
MAKPSNRKPNRRTFLKRAALGGAAAAAAVGAGGYWLGSRKRASRSGGKKVIVIGIDGMDPGLSASMMKQGQLPNLQKLAFRKLGTSIPPQSPVAWANFINGAGPGSHGIFDFIHRHPHESFSAGHNPFYSASETVPGEGGWEVGDHRLPLDFWPFNHKLPSAQLRRQGVPFWDYLDAAGVPSTFFDLPSNYPPSPSQHGHHRCICGMGTPDMLGDSFGTYQHYADNNPPETVYEAGGRRYHLSFEADTAKATITGPENSLLKEPRPITVDLLIHRDKKADAALLEVQGQRILLKAGQWSRWIKLNFNLTTPWFVPSKNVSGICRFYLQEVAPNFRLYVTPINMDPSAPALKISEPASFITDVSQKRGLFYTTGFQEDYSARKNKVFLDDEFLKQANMVLEERLALFEYAVDNYDDGLLFFYFSSSDLQSHIFWWDSDDKHPIRLDDEAKACFGHVKRLYQRLDQVVGDILERYGSQATILVMSDHGFSNFGRQFNLNTWLRSEDYILPKDCKSLTKDVDWSQTISYGLGINGLYLNLKGREPNGIVEPGDQQEELLARLTEQLESVTDPDFNGQRVIRAVYRADKVYSGNATALAPDLIIGYSRGYRASWATCLGDMTDDILLDNDQAWSADHCADALEVPGVLFSNRAIRADNPSLVDVAPSILSVFGLPVPSSMEGKTIFGT